MNMRSDCLFLPAISCGFPPGTMVMPWMRWGEGGGFNFKRETFLSRDNLFLCDNLDLLNMIPDGCVDLVYIDPPFGTGKKRESSQTENKVEGYNDAISDPSEFIEWLAPRLIGLWRILQTNGSLIIHLDPRAVHHVRVWCDLQFGPEHWENEIIWHYTGGGRSKIRLSKKHDVLLWYSKSPSRVFNIDTIREPYKPTSGYAKGGITSRSGKKYLPNPDGTPADDVWDIPIINPMASERTPYPTQKPLKLLERIVSVFSTPGSLVCDIFSGSGTTAVASRILGRPFLGCDMNPDAIGVTLKRLSECTVDASPPALISHGFYRLPIASSKSAELVAETFCCSAIRMDLDSRCKVIHPSWNGEDDLPSPLSSSDTIAFIMP
jgi:site-specific DNA-methyltransferase (adenine-specific)